MGITLHASKILKNAKAEGAIFNKVCQIGRQALMLHSNDRVKIGLNKDDLSIHNGDYQWPWADSFYRDVLKAETVQTLDYSKYEGADLIHDLNSPLPPEKYNQFDIVIDGGTLEHIFNVPEALKSYMNLVKIGGRVFIFTPANDNCGHGFYQFSPEFFYRTFNEANGFEIRKLWLVTHPFPSNFLSSKEVCYEVKDPVSVEDRVIISRSGPMMIMVEAKKINGNKPFSSGLPLQSDYVTEWNKTSVTSTKSQNILRAVKNCIIGQLPLTMRYWLRGQKQIRLQSLKGSPYVTEIK
jgi:SAM-dependent methyltransferase